MRKIKLNLKFLLLIVASLSFVPYLAFAGLGTAGSAASLGGSLASSAASGAYSAKEAAQCKPPKGIRHCIQSILGIVQKIKSLAGASNSSSSGSALAAGDFASFFDQDSGFCFDPSTGCTPDALDNDLSDLSTAFKTGQGLDEALQRLRREEEAKLADFEKQGFKVDQTAGTITDPSGKTTSFAAAASRLPKNFGKDAEAKVAKLIDSINKKTGRGLASVGGGAGAGGGGTVFKDEFYGGGKPRKGFGFNGKNHKKKKAKELLAGLSDKDKAKGGIGIAGDNIFGMINRRYLKKTKSKEFLKKQHP